MTVLILIRAMIEQSVYLQYLCLLITEHNKNLVNIVLQFRGPHWKLKIQNQTVQHKQTGPKNQLPWRGILKCQILKYCSPSFTKERCHPLSVYPTCGVTCHWCKCFNIYFYWSFIIVYSCWFFSRPFYYYFDFLFNYLVEFPSLLNV